MKYERRNEVVDAIQFNGSNSGYISEKLGDEYEVKVHTTFSSGVCVSCKLIITGKHVGYSVNSGDYVVFGKDISIMSWEEFDKKFKPMKKEKVEPARSMHDLKMQWYRDKEENNRQFIKALDAIFGR